jgi:hypothetical protein
MLILFFGLSSEWEMRLSTKESTFQQFQQDFLRGQTSNGTQTVRLTRDNCFFPHSEKIANSFLFLVLLGFELRALIFLGRSSTTSAMPSALFFSGYF